MTGKKGNELREKIQSGERVYGTFIGITDVQITHLFAQLGFDYLIIDNEHSAINPETLQQMLLMFEGTETCPIVRVPWHEPGWSKWALDFGAEGIMFPNVSTPEMAQQVVSNCKYPPEGSRGFFPKTASNFLLNMDEYMEGINDRILVWPQIEHIDAVNCLPDILKVPGIDAIYVGPADLSNSLGILNDYENPLFWETLNRIFGEARKKSVAAAFHLYDTSVEVLEKLPVDVRILSFGFDFIFARLGAQNTLKGVKEVLGSH
ncbi:MAG: hypothetical protein JEZ06_04125 [Anaerolineaceae bacterium]|nr:hypothetical protein [Anaerolineaceae bacterium]